MQMSEFRFYRISLRLPEKKKYRLFSKLSNLFRETNRAFRFCEVFLITEKWETGMLFLGTEIN